MVAMAQRLKYPRRLRRKEEYLFSMLSQSQALITVVSVKPISSSHSALSCRSGDGATPTKSASPKLGFGRKRGAQQAEGNDDKGDPGSSGGGLGGLFGGKRVPPPACRYTLQSFPNATESAKKFSHVEDLNANSKSYLQ